MNYDEWNEVKKKISKNHNSLSVKVGRIYWVKIGLNIGNEVYGKGKDYARPVLVINKLFDSAGNKIFLGVPLSSKIYKNTNKYRYVFNSNKGLQSALLSQIRVFDNKRIAYQSSIKIFSDDVNKIKELIKNEIIN